MLEIIVIAIHPVWLRTKTLWFLNYYPLYFVMVLRLIFAFRVVILHSHVFDSTKVQSIANLNKINIGALSSENIRLIIRVFMSEAGDVILAGVILVTWVLVAWMIRLCESQYNHLWGSQFGVSDFGDAFWLVIMTSTTIGYGDVVQKMG